MGSVLPPDPMFLLHVVERNVTGCWTLVPTLAVACVPFPPAARFYKGKACFFLPASYCAGSLVFFFFLVFLKCYTDFHSVPRGDQAIRSTGR
jgi:hypothetical protein